MREGKSSNETENGHKVRICHQTSSPTHPSNEISVDWSAWPAHAAHGDGMATNGPCLVEGGELARNSSGSDGHYGPCCEGLTCVPGDDGSGLGTCQEPPPACVPRGGGCSVGGGGDDEDDDHGDSDRHRRGRHRDRDDHVDYASTTCCEGLICVPDSREKGGRDGHDGDDDDDDHGSNHGTCQPPPPPPCSEAGQECGDGGCCEGLECTEGVCSEPPTQATTVCAMGEIGCTAPDGRSLAELFNGVIDEVRVSGPYSDEPGIDYNLVPANEVFLTIGPLGGECLDLTGSGWYRFQGVIVGGTVSVELDTKVYIEVPAEQPAGVCSEQNPECFDLPATGASGYAVEFPCIVPS